MIKQNKQTKIVKIYISNVDYHSEQQFSSMAYDQNKNNRLACKDREPQFQQNKCLQQQHLKQCICLKKRGAYSGKGTAKQAFPAWDMIKHHQTSMQIQKNHNFNEISCLQQQPSSSSSTETKKKKKSIHPPIPSPNASHCLSKKSKKKKSTEVRANYFPDSNRNSSIHSSENPKTQHKKKKEERVQYRSRQLRRRPRGSAFGARPRRVHGERDRGIWGRGASEDDGAKKKRMLPPLKPRGHTCYCALS